MKTFDKTFLHFVVVVWCFAVSCGVWYCCMVLAYGVV